MKCVSCKTGTTRVTYTHALEHGGIRRLRRCAACGHRFTTHEVMVEPHLDDAPRLARTRHHVDREAMNARKRTERKVREAAKVLGESTASVRRQWNLKPGECL